MDFPRLRCNLKVEIKGCCEGDKLRNEHREYSQKMYTVRLLLKVSVHELLSTNNNIKIYYICIRSVD